MYLGTGLYSITEHTKRNHCKYETENGRMKRPLWTRFIPPFTVSYLPWFLAIVQWSFRLSIVYGLQLGSICVEWDSTWCTPSGSPWSRSYRSSRTYSTSTKQFSVSISKRTVHSRVDNLEIQKGTGQTATLNRILSLPDYMYFKQRLIMDPWCTMSCHNISYRITACSKPVYENQPAKYRWIWAFWKVSS